MAISFSPMDTLQGWGQALNSPLGIMLLIGAIIYIILRITGVIQSNPFNKSNKNNRNSEGYNRPPDYILK